MQQCASPGPLEGGPKDEDAPELMGSDPPKYTRNIMPKKILIEFDEFLVLKDLGKNLIISPPLNEDPEIKLRGKRVLIKNHKDIIFDTNTTYTYYFGNAIRDLHEGNPIENFEFVFSTGSSLDSLSIRGNVLNAQHLIPEESVYVCLYNMQQNDTIPLDSLPYFVRPYYVSRTNEFGEYQLNNIRYDNYLLFAVKDVNSNYYFDMPNEEIAFVDSLCIPQEVFDYIPDSIQIDTSDQLLMDSLWKYHSQSTVHQPVNLFMFHQDDSIPKLMETVVEENKKIELHFKFPVRDSIHIHLLNDSIPLAWYVKEFSPKRDTLSLWLSRIPRDSMIIQIQVDTLQADTLKLLVKSTPKKKTKRSRKSKKNKKKKKTEKNIIKYSSNLKTSLAFYDDINMKFETPISYVNFSNMVLYEDSIIVNPQIYFTDSIQRNLKIRYEWKQDMKYKFILPQEAMKDMFGLENDSIVFNFNTTSEDVYGNIKLDFSLQQDSTSNILLFLVKGEAEKETIVQEHVVSSDTTIVFKFIPEGDYMIKAIVDYNHNGYWNSGNYGNQLLAEPVYFFQKQLNVKAGWDIQEVWQVKADDQKRLIIKKEKKKDKDKKKKETSLGL